MNIMQHKSRVVTNGQYRFDLFSLCVFVMEFKLYVLCCVGVVFFYVYMYICVFFTLCSYQNILFEMCVNK